MARSVTDREQIVGRLERELDARPEIMLALLHGSFARGGPYRDVDVAVWIDPDLVPPEDRFRYAVDLSVQLHLRLERPIDVRVLNDAPLAFRYHALQGRPLVARDEEWLDEFRARTWDDYIDFLPFARAYLRKALDEEVHLDRLDELSGHVRNALRQLRQLGPSSLESFVGDSRTVNSAKYLLIVAAEAALDICNHLAARRSARSPEDYAACMAIMEEIGVIDHDLRTRLCRWHDSGTCWSISTREWTTVRSIGSSVTICSTSNSTWPASVGT